jgi:hypothetical protein
MRWATAAGTNPVAAVFRKDGSQLRVAGGDELVELFRRRQDGGAGLELGYHFGENGFAFVGFSAMVVSPDRMTKTPFHHRPGKPVKVLNRF